MTGWFGVGTPVFLGLGCEGCAGFAGFFVLVTGACSGPTVTLGADFAVFPFLLVFVTSLHVGAQLPGRECVGLGWASSPDNTAPADNVVPTRSKVLPGGWPRFVRLWRARKAGCADP